MKKKQDNKSVETEQNGNKAEKIKSDKPVEDEQKIISADTEENGKAVERSGDKAGSDEKADSKADKDKDKDKKSKPADKKKQDDKDEDKPIFEGGFSVIKLLKFIKDKLFAPYAFLLIYAPVVNLIVESLSRRNVWGGFVYLYQHPFLFLYNSLIILFTLSVSLIFARKLFAATLLSIVWVGFGLTNCILLGYRTTPFNANDLKITTVDIIQMYTENLIIPIILGFIALVGILIFLWKILPKRKTKFRYSLIFILLVAILLFATTSIGTSTNGLLTTFPNIANAYKDYGFAYCFSCSVVDRGIKRPAGYSEQLVSDIVSKYYQPNTQPDDTPNIILVQLESFFDPNRIVGVKYSENPIPNFTKLKKEGMGGFVIVPSISAGTANTEFEILASMSLDYFGPGEYPFATILKKKPCESICWDLEEYGYSTHGIHNNLGTFYSRTTAYKNLGFDSYTSIEYMDNITYNRIGWAEDRILTKHVLDALASTPDQQDFVFTVTVQGHGKYPTEYAYELPITVSGSNEKFTNTPFTYFVDQLYETDKFIGELTDELRKSDEHTIVIMYGDHLPGLNIENEDLKDGDVFNSDYFIWANYDWKPNEKAHLPEQMYAYQFSSYILDLLGMNAGNMTKLNQTCSDDPEYDHDMLVLQYDILYGKQYCRKGMTAFGKPKMQMGVLPITFTGYTYNNGMLIVSGTNFTGSSKIFINDKVVENTVWANGSLLYAENVKLKDGDKIEVKQYTTTGRKLSKTAPINFRSSEPGLPSTQPPLVELPDSMTEGMNESIDEGISAGDAGNGAD